MSLDDFESEHVAQIAKEYRREDIPKWDKIDIGPDEWAKIKERGETDVKDWLVETIRTNKIPPPYSPITEEEARADYEKLKEFDSTKLVTHDEYYIKHDVDGKWDKPMGIMFTMNNTGNKASNYFHEKSRFKADSTVAYGVDFTWNNDRLLRRTLNALWTLKVDRVNHTTLKQIMQLRGYIPSQFKPVVAKAVYEMFEAENVFDMSMGWGDRLCGFSASKYASYYYGTDPNKNTWPDYHRQIPFYNEKHIEYELWNLPAEDLTEYPKRHIDLAFTSPPYFNKEKYSEDKEQSWKRYPNITMWLKEFLFPSLKFQWEKIRKDGVMIVNISDVFVDGDWQVICDPMNEYIQNNLDGAKYMGHMGMKMAKRPNVHSAQDGTFAEPMWVWKKV
jgi:hypothetical protein